VTRLTSSAFPELQRVFSGYLHEDFVADAGTPSAALKAFRDDASPDDLRRFRREVKRFIALTGTLDLPELRALLARLGCRWIPPSRQALVTLLTQAADPRSPERT
jgi:hypothetical protein